MDLWRTAKIANAVSKISSMLSGEKQEQSPEWTITDEGGTPILPISAIFSVNVTNGGSVVSEPVEQGSFTSYNKTTEALSIKVEMGFQGGKGELHMALSKLQEMKDSVNKFSIVTPYQEYLNMALENFDYTMSTDNGLGVLIVNASFVEIREVAPQFSQVDVSTIQANQQQTQAADEGAGGGGDSGGSAISSEDASSSDSVSPVDSGQVSPTEPTGDEAVAADDDNESILYKIKNAF